MIREPRMGEYLGNGEPFRRIFLQDILDEVAEFYYIVFKIQTL